jgi:hypothetical protein
MKHRLAKYRLAKYRSTVAYVAVMIVVAGALAPLVASRATKFSVWTYSWTDSPIPLLWARMDPRNDRQYVPPGADGEAIAFATAYKGHLYIHQDEPDIEHYVDPITSAVICTAPPATYATRFHDFVVSILAVDPTARFSPGGFTEGAVICGPHATVYAEQFYNAYVTAYGVAPPVTEWRFHHFINFSNTNIFKTDVAAYATWSMSHGAPLYVGSAGLPDTPQAWDVRPQMVDIMNFVNADSRIVGLAWWNYDIYYDGLGTPQYHGLASFGSTTNPRALSAEGVQYAAYTQASVSAARSGIVEVGDFTGDGFADFADHDTSAKRFWVHRNLQNGSFDTGNWAIGDLVNGVTPSDWDVLVADFDGDGLADFADLHVPTSQAWVHRNLGNGSFDTANWAWGQGRSGADWELLAGDFDGDGRADLIEHQLSTGLLWVLRSQVSGGANVFLPAYGSEIGHSVVGPDWKVIVADFTGDGKADIADLHIPSNRFWIHANVPWTTTYSPGVTRVFNSTNWGSATVTASSGWETIIGDFTGDGRADYADRSTVSGTFYIHQNLGNGTFAVPDWGVGNSAAGATWTILGSR